MAAVLRVFKDDDERWLVVLRDDRQHVRQETDDPPIVAARDTQTDAEELAQVWARSHGDAEVFTVPATRA
jgi:hypothetical protein